MLSATSTPGVNSYARGEANGGFSFLPFNLNLMVADGGALVVDQSPGSGGFSIGNYIHEGNQTSYFHDGNQTSYNPTVEMSGVVGPGTYYYSSNVGAETTANYNYTASSSASASETFSLTLTPTTQAPTPEPASLTLLGMGGLCLGGVWWRKRRALLKLA
jgi:hypothetical protein